MGTQGKFYVARQVYIAQRHSPMHLHLYNYYELGYVLYFLTLVYNYYYAAN